MRSLLRYLDLSSGDGRLAAMEGLRAYAAFIVLFVHAGEQAARRLGIDLFDPAQDSAPKWLLRWLFASQYGVDIFFLISGYLIAGLVARQDFHYGRFLLHRVLRIYPAMLASFLPYLVFALLVSGRSFSVGDILANAILLNGIPGSAIADINYVTWSLFFEFAFYLVFPPLFLAMRCGRWAQVTGSTLVALLLITALAELNAEYCRFAMFLAGVWLRLLPDTLLARIRSACPELFVLLVYLAVTTAFVLDPGDWILFTPLYIGPAFLLANWALHGRGVLFRLFAARPLRLFGNLSFSFYLLHPVGLKLANFMTAGVSGYAGVAVFLLLGIGLSTALAYVSFLLFERPYFLYRHHVARTVERPHLAQSPEQPQPRLR